MTGLVLLFVTVFALNVVPAFAPPTWVAMSLVGFRHPEARPWLLALVAAVAATSGRLVLASLSDRLVRNKLLGDATRANIDVLRQALEGKRALTAAGMLVSPLARRMLSHRLEDSHGKLEDDPGAHRFSGRVPRRAGAGA